MCCACTLVAYVIAKRMILNEGCCGTGIEQGADAKDVVTTTMTERIAAKACRHQQCLSKRDLSAEEKKSTKMYTRRPLRYSQLQKAINPALNHISGRLRQLHSNVEFEH